jgi:hypothetical protein
MFTMKERTLTASKEIATNRGWPPFCRRPVPD